MHQVECTNDAQTLKILLQGFLDFANAWHPIVFPAYPQTRRFLSHFGKTWPFNIRPIEPVSSIDMLLLKSEAQAIFTDSGGSAKGSLDNNGKEFPR